MIICRHEHGHVGYGAQNTHVLNALMACAVIGRSNAAVMGARGYNYRQILEHYFPGADLTKLYD